MRRAPHKKISQRTFLVGLKLPHMTRHEMDVSLSELERLIYTAGGEVVGVAHQEIKQISPATFIGRGKVVEIAAAALEAKADLIVIDGELTPVQNRNLEDETNLFVIDRPAVILDIFARRARTKEGKLQVELAQLDYLGPRLVGRGTTFSQQAGRIGTRGPGETELEYDRRRIKDRISLLHKSLELVRSHRELHRQKRQSVPLPTVAMVGYTNAGKSTLLNSLTKADVLVEDKLFATLDPTVRQLKLPSGRMVLLADTVGFIRRLPHQLIEAFRATFEETASADLLLVIVDASDPESNHQLEVVSEVLSELKLSNRPQIVVANKSDIEPLCLKHHGAVEISALRGNNLAKLLGEIDERLSSDLTPTTLFIPYSKTSVVEELKLVGQVHKLNHTAKGIRLSCSIPPKQLGRYMRFKEDKDVITDHQ